MCAAEDRRYGLVVRFEVLDGHEEAFDTLTAETVAEIEAQEPGTLAYITHTEEGSPSVRIFYELYRDVVAFEAHEAGPHVQRFLAERVAHLRGDPLVWRVHPAVGVWRESVGLDGD
ncbi:MAG TPA: antibiotic biosynthesis monooxygenase [Acidimicrobiia bacterium]|nr:antibiotic biosynthesis monooxygenase [Acidimicrobiia bacterium]